MIEALTEKNRLCDCTTVCCLHVYADAMLEMLYQFASECAECEGEGEVVISSVQRDVDWWDETKGPCSACKDVRDLIRLVDPCGDRLERAETLKREAAEEPENDIAF